MPGNIIKIALIDDHILFRKTLNDYLSRQKFIDVTFEASSVLELTTKLNIKAVDILLLDVFMPELNINHALQMIKTDYPHIKTIVLSMCTDISIVNELLDIGIHGYISKSDDPEELLNAIKSAYANKIYRNNLFTEALYWGSQNNIKVNRKKVSFSEREKTIIQLLWEEKNNKEIAGRLFLSVRSVEKIRQDIKERLGVKTTIGLLKYALKNKLINVAFPLSENDLEINYIDKA
jgi:DNA-binding NarL/FixJ family response regulator